MACLILFSALFILNQHFLLVVSQLSPNFECFHFPEKHPSAPNLQSDAFNTKTSYLKAWQFIRQRFNATLPVDNSCTPVYLFFLGRHAIRFPMRKEIQKFQDSLPSIQQELLLGGRLDALVQSELQNWKLFTHQSESARVTLSGKLDTSLQARHFLQHFPSLLNIDNANIEFGVTSKIRTTETARAFLSTLIELQIRRNESSYDEANAIREQLLKEKFALPVKDNIIMTHERCKKHRTAERKAFEKKEYTELSRSEPIKSLVAQFSRRNGLSINTTFETISTVYQICTNEMAILQHSPWCQLFTTNELKSLSYMTDTYEYHRSSNADNRIGCTIMKDLYSKLDAILQQPSSKGKTKATLYFTHKGMISRFVRYLGLFDNFPNHFIDNERLCAADREWRSSNVLPYGANFVSILYECNQKQRKLLSLYNEVPVKIPGCSNVFCDLSEFSRHYKNLPCQVDEICPN